MLRLRCHLIASWGLALLLVATSQAQEGRHDLGRRVRAMERAYETAGPEVRARSLSALESAVVGYFSGRLGHVARKVDQARLALTMKDAPASRVAAAAVHAAPSSRLLEPGDTLGVEVRAAYEVPVESFAGLRMVVTLKTGKEAARRRVFDLEKGPAGKVAWTLDDVSPGDHRLHWSTMSADDVLDEGSVGVSVVPRARARLAALADATAEGAETLELATVRACAARLKKHMERSSETDLPATRLLADAEAALASEKPFYTAERTGQHWLELPTRRRPTTARLLVPSAAKGKRPIVVALHGMGGSENLFFDSYGDGKIVRLCEARGWYLIAPRAGLGPPRVTEILDLLAQRYPIDEKRVLIIGHSMGAGHLTSVVGRAPERFAACAPVSGGGRIRVTPALDGIPFFCAAGAEDFSLTGTRRLHAALDRESRKARLVLEIHEGAEHLTAVQAALDDIFRFFDDAVR